MISAVKYREWDVLLQHLWGANSPMAHPTESFSSNFQPAQLFTDVLMLSGQLCFMAEWRKMIGIIFIPADRWRSTRAFQFIKNVKKNHQAAREKRVRARVNRFLSPATKALVSRACELRLVLHSSNTLPAGGSHSSKSLWHRANIVQRACSVYIVTQYSSCLLLLVLNSCV